MDQGTDAAGLFEIIQTTRAIRRLKPDPVPKELVEQILRAGHCAPTGGNPIDFDFKTDDTYWVEVKDGRVIFGNDGAPATHNAQNIGTGRYRELLIEIK